LVATGMEPRMAQRNGAVPRPAGKKVAPMKKTAPVKKAAVPVKKPPVPVKKAPVPAKKAAQIKKAVPAKKAAQIKKAVPAKKAAQVKKAVPVKKAPVPAKKAAPVKKAPVPAKKAAPVKPAPPAKVAAVKAPPVVTAVTVAAKPVVKKSSEPKPAPPIVWTAGELAEITSLLDDEIQRLREEIDVAESDIADLLRDSGDGAGDDQADAGTKTFEREHEMSVANNAKDMLLQVERAMIRIADGTYGRCEQCGNSIGKARLQAFPRATMCMACKEREDRR
jgi:RNA polymerase-binding protein DksA